MLKRPLVLYSIALGTLLAYAIPAWFTTLQHLYGAIDGLTYQFFLRQFVAWLTPLQQTGINLFQGLGTPYLLIPPWLNPGYLAFTSVQPPWGAILSYTIFLVELFGTTILLGQVTGLPPILTALTAQLLCLVSFPPSDRVVGGFGQYILNPGLAHILAIGNLGIALLMLLGNRPGWANLVWVSLLPILLLYSVYCDPLWTVVLGIPLFFFAIGIIVAKPNRRGVVWSLIGLAGVGITALVFQLPTFYQGLSQHPARSLLRYEILGAPRLLFFASLPFQGPTPFVFFVLMLVGLGLAVYYGRPLIRRLSIFGLVYAGLLILISLAFLVDLPKRLGYGNWTYPLPSYLDFGAFSITLVLTMQGFSAMYQRLAWQWNRLQVFSQVSNKLGSGSLILLPALAGVALLLQPNPTFWAARNIPNIHLKPLPEPPILKQVVPELQLRPPSATFRGFLATVVEDPEKLMLERVYLWHKQVPTLEEYTQLVSPNLHYLASRVFSKPNQSYRRNRVYVYQMRPQLLAMLGVRFVVTDRPVHHASVTLKQQSELLSTYELSNPNVGNYSPTQVLPVTTGREIVTLLNKPEFDPTQQVILTQPVSEALVAAERSTLSYEKGGQVRVTATSSGHSLLLLPLQFSHCLDITPLSAASDPQARLLSANLAESALLFEKNLDVMVTFKFGLQYLGQNRCRLQDLKDIQALQLVKDQIIPSKGN